MGRGGGDAQPGRNGGPVRVFGAKGPYYFRPTENYDFLSSLSYF